MTIEATLQYGVRSLNPQQKTTGEDEGQQGRDVVTKPPCESYALSPSVPLLTYWQLTSVSFSEERVILAFKHRLGKCQTVR